MNDGRACFCAYKLDLAKVYNKVDWGFLRGMLYALGFSGVWIKWIMACVTSIKYVVHFNGPLLDSFAQTRGIWKGGPLLLYLFYWSLMTFLYC